MPMMAAAMITSPNAWGRHGVSMTGAAGGAIARRAMPGKDTGAPPKRA